MSRTSSEAESLIARVPRNRREWHISWVECPRFLEFCSFSFLTLTLHDRSTSSTSAVFDPFPRNPLPNVPRLIRRSARNTVSFSLITSIINHFSQNHPLSFAIEKCVSPTWLSLPSRRSRTPPGATRAPAVKRSPGTTRGGTRIV